MKRTSVFDDKACECGKNGVEKAGVTRFQWFRVDDELQCPTCGDKRCDLVRVSGIKEVGLADFVESLGRTLEPWQKSMLGRYQKLTRGEVLERWPMAQQKPIKKMTDALWRKLADNIPADTKPYTMGSIVGVKISGTSMDMVTAGDFYKKPSEDPAPAIQAFRAAVAKNAPQ